MHTRLLLEGPDIETLLAQIRDDHGSAARIVSADKVRTGGIGGFFAHERFAIAVDIDDDLRPVDRVVAFEPIAGVGPVVGARSRRPSRHAASPGAPADGIAALDSVDALLDRADAAEHLLDQAGAAAGPTQNGAAAPAGGPQNGAGGSALEEIPAFATLLATLRGEPVDEQPIPAPAPRHAATLADSPAGVAGGFTADSTTDRMVGSAAASTANQSSSTSTPTPTADRPPSRPTADRPKSTPTADRPKSTADRPKSTSTADRSNGTFTALRPTVLPTADFVANLMTNLMANLMTLGVPEPIARLAGGPDRYAGTLRAMAELPPPPAAPAGPGEVLVIAGETAAARELAVELSVAMRWDPDRVMVAAPTASAAGVPADRAILGPAEAARLAPQLRAADGPQLVVVAAPADGTSAAWAAAVALALRATTVWALVDATRKTTDTIGHLLQLGRVDALAGYATAASGDPATMLGIGLPVAYLDGRPATAAAWTALLCDRLTGTPVPA